MTTEQMFLREIRKWEDEYAKAVKNGENNDVLSAIAEIIMEKRRFLSMVRSHHRKAA